MEWGLEAVVRGSCTSTGVAAEEAAMQSIDWFDLRLDDYEYNYAATFSSGDNFVEAKALDDLEAVYRPFYPGFQGGLSSSVTNQETEGFESLGEMPAVSPVVATPDAALATKYKRRKNQQKRVVEQVTADGVSLDKWAWRKYGQKPIKGSPYPRSYYRCSSSKGCSARKQVERSTSDPDIFIVSYTGEHNHMQPARRNALAGSTRSKFSTSANNKKSRGATADAVESPISSSVVNSPTCSGSTPLASSLGSAAGGGSEDGQTINFSDVFTEKFLVGFDGMDWNNDYGDLLQASQPALPVMGPLSLSLEMDGSEK